MLLTITKVQKQTKCSEADELIRKFHYINPVEYYSAFKKKNFDIYNNLNLEHIILNKVSQAERETPHVLADMWNPKSSHSKTLNWSVGVGICFGRTNAQEPLLFHGRSVWEAITANILGCSQETK